MDRPCSGGPARDVRQHRARRNHRSRHYRRTARTTARRRHCHTDLVAMTAQRRRLDALEALARDPGATEAERQLAAEHLARYRRDHGSVGREEAHQYIEVEVDDELVAAFDRAMARAAKVKSPKY